MKEIIQTEPEFRFVFVKHDGLENAKEVWGKIKDCDVILLEHVGYSKKEKLLRERNVYLATNKSWTPAGLISRYTIFSRKNRNWGNSIIADVVKSRKEFHLIDVEPDSLPMKISGEWKNLYTESFELLHSGEPIKALDTFEKGIKKLAESNRMRAETISIQIQSISGESGGGNGKKTAIIQGLGHSLTYDLFNKIFAESKKGRVTKVFMEDPMPGILGLANQLEQDSNKHLPKTDLIKVFLGIGILFPYLQTLRPKTDEDDLYALADQVMYSLTDEEVGVYWKIINNKELKYTSPITYWKVAYTISKRYGLEEPSLDI